MKRDLDNNRMLIGIIGGAVLIVLTMMVSIFIVTRRPVVVVISAAGSGTHATAASATAPAALSAVAEAPPAEIKVTKAEQAPSIDNPLDPFWEKIAVVDVDLLPQQAAPPVLAKGTVAKLRVQAVRDGQRYVWRLNWDQPVVADRSDVGEFSDAVAMQFPLTDGAPYTMGGPKMPVRMLYWKAIWQKDVDLGFQDLVTIQPNSDSDFYWFTNGEAPYSVTKSFENPFSKQWMIAASAGNPMVDFHRQHPLEELTAHGFGSSTHVGETPSRGRGVWKDGQWYVVIDRPIDSSDPLITRFNENPQQQLIAFAVWDGNASNRGARKNITNWIVMRIDP
jgi:DMSO reductase family type II enzyme heme b subunit